MYISKIFFKVKKFCFYKNFLKICLNMVVWSWSLYFFWYGERIVCIYLGFDLKLNCDLVFIFYFIVLKILKLYKGEFLMDYIIIFVLKGKLLEVID